MTDIKRGTTPPELEGGVNWGDSVLRLKQAAMNGDVRLKKELLYEVFCLKRVKDIWCAAVVLL